MLKETVLTTQFHLKELSNDLEQITYSTPLSRIHVKLPGKLWQDKLKEMREELGKFESTLAEKEELERVCTEQKRKILIL
jgi:signal recognition particle GTPase